MAKYAPAVFVLDSKGQPALYHKTAAWSPRNKAVRDEPLHHVRHGPGRDDGRQGHGRECRRPAIRWRSQQPVQVFFGNPGYSQAGIIVDWSGLVPGMVGVYEINLRVPGNHLKGDALPIQVRIGGVFSVTTGANVPYAAVD